MPGLLSGTFRAWEEAAAAGTSLFEEEPVPLSVFVQDGKYLANPPLSEVQYEAVRHAERIYYPSTYEMLARSDDQRIREYWGEPYRLVNFCELEWGKGCKIAGMEYYDADSGRWETVESSSEPGVVAAMRPGGAPEYAPRSPFFKAGSGRCLEVKTRSGYETTVHQHHQFLTREADGESFWRCLTQMKEGDWVATSRSLPEPLNPLRVDPREAELVGLWLGDGNMPRFTQKLGPALKDGSRKKYRSLTQLRMYAGYAAPAELARYRELCESFDGVSLRAQDTGSKWLLVATNNYAHANPVTEIARRWGLYGKTVRDKRVPPELMGLCREQAALLLSRLIDTDGSVYFEKTGQPRIEFASASPGLIMDVRRLMLRLGARSTVRERVTRCQQPDCEGHLSQRLVVTDIQSLAALSGTLTLLDKQLRLDSVKIWLASRKVPSEPLYWDRIKSLTDAGIHEFYDTEVTGAAGVSWPSEAVQHEPESPGLHNYLSTGFLDHNGGKDHTCRIIALRVCYLLLCLVSPQRYLAMPEQDSVHVLNVASSSRQASLAFFTPMRRAVLRPGNWFRTRAEPIDAIGRRRSSSRTGTAQVLQDTIRFEKNVEAVSGHSDADSQEGLNLILGIADEIDAFKSRAELLKTGGARERESSSSAEAILGMLRTSASTRFPETYKNVHISYPRFKGSTIQKLVAEGNEDIARHGLASSRYYVSGPLATWEANPRVQRGCAEHGGGKNYRGGCKPCWEACKDQFRKDYDENRALAEGKYECRPSRAVNPYFANMAAIEACLAEHPEPPLQVAYVRDGAAWTPVYGFADRLFPVAGAAYAMHADMAISRDRAGIALAHVATWNDVTVAGQDERGREVAVLQPRPCVKLDFAITFEADLGAQPAREIQVRWARDLCLELIRRGFNIRRYTMDGFQSSDSLQIIETHGIETDRVSTDLSEEPWRTLRDLAYEDRLRGHRDKLLLDELAGLSKLPNGKIDHLADGSKDLADAVACACTGAVVLGGREDPAGTRAYLSGDWVMPQSSFDPPAGMPAGMGALSFDGDLPAADLASPAQFGGGDGWLFADTGNAYSGSV